jgi:hypothetical protein
MGTARPSRADAFWTPGGGPTPPTRGARQGPGRAASGPGQTRAGRVPGGGRAPAGTAEESGRRTQAVGRVRRLGARGPGRSAPRPGSPSSRTAASGRRKACPPDRRSGGTRAVRRGGSVDRPPPSLGTPSSRPPEAVLPRPGGSSGQPTGPTPDLAPCRDPPGGPASASRRARPDSRTRLRPARRSRRAAGSRVPHRARVARGVMDPGGRSDRPRPRRAPAGRQRTASPAGAAAARDALRRTPRLRAPTVHPYPAFRHAPYGRRSRGVPVSRAPA